MKRCKIAQKLYRKVDREYEKSLYSGFCDDYVDAYEEYVHHIEEHGCWRDEIEEK